MAAERRGSSAERGYGYKWQQARAGYLRKHPLCVECQSRGRTVAATVVDHKVAHRGDMTVFWDKANWQSLCKHCHDSWKQRMEKSGRGAGCSVDGIPSAPGHHWHQGGRVKVWSLSLLDRP